MNLEIIKSIKDLDILIGRNIIKDKKDRLLPPYQMAIVGYLVKHQNDSVYQKDLEKKFEFRRSTLSGILDTMEKHDLIKREDCLIDHRSKKIVLGDRTKIAYENALDNLGDLSNKLVSGISENELNIFNSVMEKMIKNMKENLND